MKDTSSSLPQSSWPQAIVQAPSVVSQAEQRLRHSSYPSHRQLRCTYGRGVLTLHGRVRSYYQRQLACVLVSGLDGVDELIDRMEVVD